MQSSLSLEDTNRIRVSLGLKPIPSPAPNAQLPSSLPKPAPPPTVASDAAARVSEAQNRILHRQSTSTQALSISQQTETTQSWLTRVKNLAHSMEAEAAEPTRSPSAERPQSEIISISEELPYISSTTQQLLQSNAQTVEVDTGPGDESKSSEKLSLSPEPAAKPTQVIRDYDISKKATFKPRKARSSRRKASEDPPPRPHIPHVIEDSKWDESIITQRLEAQKRRRTHTGDEFVAKISESEPVRRDTDPYHHGGIFVSETSQFLESIRARRDDSVKRDNTDTRAESSAVPGSTEGDDQAHEPPTTPPHDNSDNTSDQAPRVEHGVAETLKLLEQQDALRRQPQKTEHTRAHTKEWMQRVAAERLRRQQERAEAEASLQSLPPAKRREYLKEIEEIEASEAAEAADRDFTDYQPNVDVVHRDKDGNVVDAKEAFRQLSRAFHGNKEGLKRAQRRLRRQNK